jgi:hypothetical protein
MIDPPYAVATAVAPLPQPFLCIVYEVCTIIRVTSRTLRILYYVSLYEIVYSIRNEVIPVTGYTSNRLYEYPPHLKLATSILNDALLTEYCNLMRQHY